MTGPTSYLGEPGGPSDPATPGGYCLAICRCGTCPQYAEQARRADLARQHDFDARTRKEDEERRGVRKSKRHTSSAEVLATDEASPAVARRLGIGDSTVRQVRRQAHAA